MSKSSTDLKNRWVKSGLVKKAWTLICKPYHAFKAVCFILGVLNVAALALMAFGTAWFFRSLPDLEKATFADLKGRAEQVVRKHREAGPKPLAWTTIDQISRDYLYSVVLSEDADFFEHEGIDFDAVVATTLQNLRKKKLEGGGSTISQQVVKNLFLSNERSFIRKLKEAVITRSLEAQLSKNQILELYLNLAEFGPDIYGVREAAEHYFDKRPSEVNAAEGAFMALMLPSPRRFHYSVFENKYLTSQKKRKIRRVLGDMLAQEFISPNQYREYIAYPYFGKPQSRVPASKKKR